MTNGQFWELVAAATNSDGDLDELPALLRESLVKLAAEEIVSFQDIFDELSAKAYRRELWGAAYLLNGGCSDDGFEYFRAWLIAHGKATYEAALENPDSLATLADPDNDDNELEDLIYVAREAYEEKTGQELPFRSRAAPELTGPEWDEADLDRLYPRIASRLER